jgi:hypothetical protein
MKACQDCRKVALFDQDAHSGSARRGSSGMKSALNSAGRVELKAAFRRIIPGHFFASRVVFFAAAKFRGI